MSPHSSQESRDRAICRFVLSFYSDLVSGELRLRRGLDIDLTTIHELSGTVFVVHAPYQIAPFFDVKRFDTE